VLNPKGNMMTQCYLFAMLPAMRTFDLLSPAEAMAKLNAALNVAARALPIETISTFDAHNRVLAQDVISPTPLPEFRRSTVDGFAVRAADTPGRLRLAGEVAMGEISSLVLRAGEAIAVPTGGHVPEGADAVVMIEQVTHPTDSQLQIANSLKPNDNLIEAGEDVRAGDAVIRAGARLREQEIAGLLALGITQVQVVHQPRVAVIASGDELVPATSEVKPGQIRNINGPMISALVRRCGGLPIDFGILPDKREAFEEAAQRAMRDCDAVVFMAGSSVGEKDFVPDVVNGMSDGTAHRGSPGILAHGIAFRPGKPTLFAVCGGKPVFGLPGNPISALVTATLFMEPTLWRMQNTQPPTPNFVRATLAQDVRSPKDLEHWVPVRLEIGDWRLGDQSPISNLQSLSATPISTKSNLIFGLVRADGLVCVPIGVDKVAAGSEVMVRLFA
jgi:molybdopterin molybdotransferase